MVSENEHIIQVESLLLPGKESRAMGDKGRDEVVTSDSTVMKEILSDPACCREYL